MKKEILLVDGMALLFRGFYATSFRNHYMFNSEGVATNGIYQFLRYLFDSIKTFQPSYIICCWDMGSKTFRNDIYEDYKANRGAPPEELIPQFTLVQEVTEALNIPNIGLINYEADDIIGTLANQYKHHHNVTILSGDYDLLQLVETNIQVAIMKKGIGNYDIFDSNNFLDKRSITPEQMIEFKALTGDNADNYPGIKGIGEKTALKLLKEHKNMHNILQSIHTLTKGLQTKIENDLELFYVCKKLAEINCQVPINYHLENQLYFTMEAEQIEKKFKQLKIAYPAIPNYN